MLPNTPRALASALATALATALAVAVLPLAACADRVVAPAAPAAPAPAAAAVEAFDGWFPSTPFERELLPGLLGLTEGFHATGTAGDGTVVGHMDHGVPVVWRSNGAVELFPTEGGLRTADVVGLGDDGMAFGAGRDADGAMRGIAGRPPMLTVSAWPLHFAGPAGSRLYDGGAGLAVGTVTRDGEERGAYFLLGGPTSGSLEPLARRSALVSVNRHGNAAGWHESGIGRRAIVAVRAPILCDPSPDCVTPPAWTERCVGGPSFLCDLGTLHGTGWESGAVGINDRREVAGWAIRGDGRMRAFRWTPWSGMTDLETPSGMHDADMIRATAISEDGRIVGTLQRAGRTYAWVWTRTRGMVTLGEGRVPTAIRGDHVVGHTMPSFTGSATIRERAITWRLPPYVDADADGLEDGIDNCPAAYNPEQANADGDARGDACDASYTVRATLVQVTPSPVSLAATALVNVVVLGSRFPVALDAAQVNAAALRLRVPGSATAVAPATRGTAVLTSLGDVNGDGVVDRLVSFRTSALAAAGLAAGTTTLLLEGSYAGEPLDGTTAPVTVQP